MIIFGAIAAPWKACRVWLLKEVRMRSFILACIAIVVIAMAGAAILNVFQESAAQAFSTDAVRL
jgi:ABC-type uncharacterized transport system permease subunit